MKAHIQRTMKNLDEAYLQERRDCKGKNFPKELWISFKK